MKPCHGQPPEGVGQLEAAGGAIAAGGLRAACQSAVKFRRGRHIAAVIPEATSASCQWSAGVNLSGNSACRACGRPILAVHEIGAPTAAPGGGSVPEVEGRLLIMCAKVCGIRL